MMTKKSIWCGLNNKNVESGHFLEGQLAIANKNVFMDGLKCIIDYTNTITICCTIGWSITSNLVEHNVQHSHRCPHIHLRHKNFE
jgi:hypothetical protein